MVRLPRSGNWPHSSYPLLAALFQASRIGSNQQGVVDLDPVVDQRLLARHRQNRAALTSTPVVYDPAKWRDVVKDIAALFPA